VDHQSAVRAVRALAAGEAEFLAALAGATDWDGFEAFLIRQRLLAWVAPALTGDAARGLAPEPLRERLVEHRRERLARNAALLRESAEVRDALAAAGIETLFLKGLYFGERLYGDPSRRQQRDVDVLVRSACFEPALEVLGRLGFDVVTNEDDGKPVALRVREIRGRSPETAPHGVTVRRGEDTRVDLHWCLTSRSARFLPEEPLWAARRPFAVDGQGFETLSDADTLMFQLVSVCSDLRRGASLAKHFLDLYLLLRAIDADLDWDAFFARRQRERLARACVNVLAVLLEVWECADELPGAARGVRDRRGEVELRDHAEALALLERPRGNEENRAWFRRVHPRSAPRWWAWRLTYDLPHTLARLRSGRRSAASPSAHR
jgi:hypothetical protein